MAEMKELFPGIYGFGQLLFTKNLCKGVKVYGEQLLESKGEEFRQWMPERSKLAAAIKKGLKEMPVKKGAHILYLGSAEGTTISHLSDIIGEEGVIFGVDISERVMRKFLWLCEHRKNIAPILGDAEQPQSYLKDLSGTKVDLLYQDVSQKNQAQIFLKNARMYLKGEGHGLLVIKVRSISQTEKAQKVVEKEIKLLEKEFEIIQPVSLEPFDTEHAMVLCKRK
ncbi:MAG: fibrillarin-like rRNA/tRNA 2'-O-methyltransferase [Candidatus Diapherotrites archaeon]